MAARRLAAVSDTKQERFQSQWSRSRERSSHMPDTALTNSKIVAAYRERTPGSAREAAVAAGALPSGITHDGRKLDPYGIYVTRAEGSRKWDLDGNDYVDYFGGHGALLLGHNHPKVLSAAQDALARGTHFGSNHPMEVRWAKLVQEMVPSAERVRFTSSGTEATLMALRLARAHTGRTKVIRFLGHFHGWHDHMGTGFNSHFDGTPTTGVLNGVAESLVLVPPGDETALAAAFDAHGDDVAAAIIEPTGSQFGMVPVRPEYLETLRDATSANGAILIFDEVVTGFRVSPGGAQAHYGVTPDLTALAKILAGGLPGGAIVGRKDILDLLDFAVTAERGVEKIQHPGTFNANPLSAATGVAALEIIKTTDACERASAYAARLRAALNGVLAEEGVPWAAYGTFSGAHIFTNPERRAGIAPGAFDPYEIRREELVANAPCVNKLRLAMLLGGADFHAWPGGQTSCMHTDADLEQTISAFSGAIHMLKREGEL
uniref:Putative aminotransferase class-III n=1 Tax=uncultured marine microorganism HF4000_APKG8L7 TaxID=455556 RepID=B3TB76_9ZZZZ|nr:putative aminotransferase class-III [uncultured marine microorganism HF4000_APKG8L7]